MLSRKVLPAALCVFFSALCCGAQERVETPLLVYAGHTGTPAVVGFLPDGNRVVTRALQDGQNVFHCWDIHSGERFWEYSHSQLLRDYLLSPDGDWLLLVELGTSDLRLVDIQNDFAVRTFIDDWTVFSAAFSPDGERIFAGGTDSEARLEIREVQSGALLRTLAAPGDWVARVAVSPDGANLLVGYVYIVQKFGQVQGMELRDIDDWDTEPRWSSEDVRLSWYGRFSPRGSFFLIVADVGVVDVYHADSLQRVLRLPGVGIKTSAISPSEKYVAINGWEGETLSEVRLMEIESGEIVRVFSVGDDSIGYVGFSPDGTRLLTGVRGKMLVWDISDLEGISEVEAWGEY